jgi:hypothetical protein
MFDGKRPLFCNTKTNNKNIYCDENGKIPSFLIYFYMKLYYNIPTSFSGGEK